MKITLTAQQRAELERGALQAQNAAEAAFKAARDRYNRTLRLGNTIDLTELASLAADLPADVAPVQPTTSTFGRKNYVAYSRSHRRDESGGLAMHNISIAHIGSTAGPLEVTCTCPGFVNHGHCWASDEAKSQFGNLLRKSGTNGVYYKGM